jgi:hypothetical protein
MIDGANLHGASRPGDEARYGDRETAVNRPRLGASGTPQYLGRTSELGDWTDYDFAVVHVVPHVHLGERVNVGVVVHARTQDFLEARLLTDAAALESRLPGTDVTVLAQYLFTHQGVARGDTTFGPIALAPSSERFHWITAPRSDVIQCSRIHSGRSQDLHATLRDLYGQYVQEIS